MPPTRPRGTESRRQGRDGNRASDGDGGTAPVTKTALLVAGMHRSGTSAIARILGILGCDLPRNLLEPHPSNERGFWESPDIVAVNREILVSAGTKQEEWRADEWRAFDPRWYASPQVERFHDRAQAVLESQFGDSPLFVIKDPRICRLLPFWIETLARFGARPLIVSPVRNPLDVAESLAARDGIQLPIGYLMWLQHVLEAEAASRELTRAFLRYEQLLSEPHAVVDRLEDALGVIWPRRMSDADAEIEAFLSSGLRHHSNEDDRVLRNPRLSAWLRGSFEILDRWARGEVQATDTAELDRIRTTLNEAMPAFDRAVSVGLTTTRELRTAQEELDRRKKQVGALTGQLDELRGYAEKLAAEIAEQETRIAERDGYAEKLAAEIAEQETRIAERDGYAEKLAAEIAEQETRIAERDGYAEKLAAEIAERDARIADRDGYAEKLAAEIAEQEARIAERDGYAEKLAAEIAERDARIADRDARIAEREGYIRELAGRLVEIDARVADRDARIADREREIADREREIGEILADRDRRIDELNRWLAVILGSKSWRLTRPLRGIVAILTGSRRAGRRTAPVGRGPIALVRKFRFYARTYGLRAAFHHTRLFIRARLPGARRRRTRNAPATSTSVAPVAPPSSAPAPATPPAPATVPAAEPETPCPPVAMLVQEFHDGGLERVVLDLTRQFVQQGMVAPVLVLGSGGRAATEAAALGCDVRTFDGDTAALVATAQDLGVRVVLAHHCYEPLERLSETGVRIVEVIHNAYHWQRDQPWFANLRSRCIGRFVAVSDFVGDYARSALLVAPDRLRVIENGLSRQGLIRPLLPTLTRRRKATVASPVLAHLAHAHPQKNHVALLRAFERLLQDRPDATLVLAGVIDASTDVGRRVETEIDALGVNGRVRCTGPLDRRAVSHLLADAHVGLLPSGFEGFSIGSLEYAYFGLPTVLSDTGAARRLGDRYGHVAVAEGAACPPGELTPGRIERDGLDPDPAAVDGIAAAMRTVLADYDRFADNAARAGRDWESYSIEAVAHRYRGLLRETAAP